MKWKKSLSRWTNTVSWSRRYSRTWNTMACNNKERMALQVLGFCSIVAEVSVLLEYDVFYWLTGFQHFQDNGVAEMYKNFGPWSREQWIVLKEWEPFTQCCDIMSKNGCFKEEFCLMKRTCVDIFSNPAVTSRLRKIQTVTCCRNDDHYIQYKVPLQNSCITISVYCCRF